ncbi:MAG: hypothetical protein Q9210_002006 [Variospora velana]
MAVLERTSAQQLAFHVKSVWLFTYSDLKTIVFTSTCSALLNAMALSLENIYALSSTLNIPGPDRILKRTPLILFWIWINLLPFNIDNQRQPPSIEEDSMNKPWRTMPSRRLSPGSAKTLMYILYPIALITSSFLGTITQCLALVVLGVWYNDLRGSDGNPLIRNIINGCGFVCFSSGAMQVAIGGFQTEVQVSESALQLYGWWFFVIACVVSSTVETQDMPDQRGDAARNRKTIPLVLGDGPARGQDTVEKKRKSR